MISIRSSLLGLYTVFAFAVHAADVAPPAPAVASVNGFCANGAFAGTKWPGGAAPHGLTIWGSFCAHGDDDKGRIEFQKFTAPEALNFFLAGYAGQEGRRLLLKNVQSGEEHELKPSTTAGEKWFYYSFAVPADWVGKPVQLIAEDDVTGPAGWLAFSMPVAATTAPPYNGFCTDGVYPGTQWPYDIRPEGITIWGSWCRKGDQDTGTKLSSAFKAERKLRVYLAGCPGTSGLSLAVQNIQSGTRLPLAIGDPPNERWQLRRFDLPSEWEGQSVRLVAHDSATGRCGWMAFSMPVAAPATEVLTDALANIGLGLLLGFGLLLPAFVLCIAAELLGLEGLRALTATGLIGTVLTLALLWRRFDHVALGIGFLLAAYAIVAFYHSGRRLESFRGRLRRVDLAPVAKSEITSRQRWVILAIVWIVALVAILPALLHWTAPKPYTPSEVLFPIGVCYAVAASCCVWFYRAERKDLTRSQTIALVCVIVLLTCMVNNMHALMVDYSSSYFGFKSNATWQNGMHQAIIRLEPGSYPNSYRFLPDAIVRWMEMAHIDYNTARDLFRFITGLLLFYSIYRYARLYCDYRGAIVAMLFTAMAYPISFEYYAGQLVDPLSHLSFVLALIFLETEEFALLLTTLVIGSIAKETVLAMAGYYVLFRRKEKHYPLKAAGLCASVVLAYFGVRTYVLGSFMSYRQTSGVDPGQVVTNLGNVLVWIFPLILVCAPAVFLYLGWKRVAPSLKYQAAYLFVVVFISSMFFSWLRETRNFMPMVFVLSVIAGSYFTQESAAPLVLTAEVKREPKAALAGRK